MSRVPAGRVSIYEHIRAHLDPSHGRLLPAGATLPDEAPPADNKLRWAPGAKDALLDEGEVQPERLETLTEALVTGSQLQGLIALNLLEQALWMDDAATYLPDLLDQLIGDSHLNREAIATRARELLHASGYRGAVKYALGLLSAFGSQSDLPSIEIIGTHEEFTRFAADALFQLSVDPVGSWQRLAQRLHGWGRVDLVLRMCEQLDATYRPDLAAWLLRHGCSHDILDMDVALPIARAAQLAKALETAEPDVALLDGAGAILYALTYPLLPHSLSEYADGPMAAERYLAFMESRAATLYDFDILKTLQDFLSVGAPDWPNQDSLQAKAKEILCQPKWRELAFQHLTDPDKGVAWTARRAARALGIDVKPTIIQLLHQDPQESGYWFELLFQANEDDVRLGIKLAYEYLPLEQMLTGPSAALGVGPGFRWHQCLDYLMQELPRFPGLGEDLLLRCLRSPVIRQRNFTLKSFQAWSPMQITDQIVAAVRETAQSDPEEKVRTFAQSILAQWDGQQH